MKNKASIAFLSPVNMTYLCLTVFLLLAIILQIAFVLLYFLSYVFLMNVFFNEYRFNLQTYLCHKFCRNCFIYFFKFGLVFVFVLMLTQARVIFQCFRKVWDRTDLSTNVRYVQIFFSISMFKYILQIFTDILGNQVMA